MPTGRSFIVHTGTGCLRAVPEPPSTRPRQSPRSDVETSTVEDVSEDGPKRTDRRRPGEVRDAIEEVLAQAAGPMRVSDIHERVEARLGGAVAASSIRSYLRLNAEANGQFIKVSRGVYALR